MTPTTFALVALAGGLGAAARFLLDGWVRDRVGGALPWGTVLINLTGSFALGLLTGLVAARTLPESWQPVLGTGFLGGYTTFSTASLDAVRLLRAGRREAGLALAVGVLVLGTALASLGLRLGGG